VTFAAAESYRGERVEMRVEVKRAEDLDEAIEAVDNRLEEVAFRSLCSTARRRKRIAGLQDALAVLRAERERREMEVSK